MKSFSLELQRIETLLLQGMEGVWSDPLALSEVFWERSADSGASGGSIQQLASSQLHLVAEGSLRIKRGNCCGLVGTWMNRRLYI